MDRLANLDIFWNKYFTNQKVQQWTLVFTAKDGDGALCSLADPLQERMIEVFVTQAAQHELTAFLRHYRRHFMTTLGGWFGSFRPNVDKVLTEYPDWEGFYPTWLNDDARLIQGNMPLLFDYPSADEYRAMQLKGADPAGYRRLLIILYQYRKQRFQRIFIKQVDDQSYLRIQHQIIDMYRDAIPELIMAPKVAA